MIPYQDDFCQMCYQHHEHPSEMVCIQDPVPFVEGSYTYRVCRTELCEQRARRGSIPPPPRVRCLVYVWGEGHDREMIILRWPRRWQHLLDGRFACDNGFSVAKFPKQEGVYALEVSITGDGEWLSISIRRHQKLHLPRTSLWKLIRRRGVPFPPRSDLCSSGTTA